MKLSPTFLLKNFISLVNRRFLHENEPDHDRSMILTITNFSRLRSMWNRKKNLYPLIKWY